MPIPYSNPKARLISAALFAACAGSAAILIAVLALVLWYLASIGIGAITTSFFTDLPTGDLANPGGMRHAILGTIILLALASAVGIPLGIGAGIYLCEYSSRGYLGTLVRFTADVLAGVPSIVVGILGYELLVVPMGNFNGYAGAAALAFIMIPIVARTTEEMLRLVPHNYREGSLALGASRSQTILRVILPSATGSLITGVMLAIARVAGETAPLLFTALGSRLLATDLSQPFPALTLQIYTYATGPYPEQKRLAWAGILVLIVLILVLNLAVRLVVARTTRVVGS
ncbi:MAG: phosphate ABC transporter permease PstA [Phycisphaerales bacterium]